MPRIIRRALLAAAVSAGATLLGTAPSQAQYSAYGQGRYCAVVNNGFGSAKEICNFNSFEACRLEVVSGNRGFCRNNSYAFAPGPGSQWAGEPGVRRSKHKRRYR